MTSTKKTFNLIQPDHSLFNRSSVCLEIPVIYFIISEVVTQVIPLFVNFFLMHT